MKSTLQLIFIFILLSGTSLSQDIATWVDTHPHVLLIHSKDASTEFIEKLNETSAEYIVYSDVLTLHDIELYELNQFSKGPSEHIDYKSGDAEFVKLWLAHHLEVKVISNSIFESMAASEQLSYDPQVTLITAGDAITLQDIEKFENTRMEIRSK